MLLASYTPFPTVAFSARQRETAEVKVLFLVVVLLVVAIIRHGAGAP